jgi:hypothetical protein
MAKSSVLETAYRLAQGVVEEVRRRDEWVYCTSEGNLPHQGGKLLVHYLGRKRFADDFLMFYDRDTVDAAVRQNIMYTAGLPRFLKERHQARTCPPEADILIVDHLMEVGADKEAITLAPHINAVLPVQPTLDEQLALIRSKGHRRRLQAALKRGISCRKTHSLADFNLFYDVMYEPFVHDRFRYGASLVARETMRRMFMHRGYLLLVEEDGIPVSGAFIYTSRKDRGVMYYWKYGLAHSKELSANVFGERNAAQEAAVLKHAIDEGFAEIDWGLTRAVPTDGIFTHKKRMGCDFKKTPGAPDFRIMVNPAARGRLLARFPLVVSHQGELIGLVAHEGDLSGKRGKELGEMLGNVAFPSIATTRLLVEPQLQGSAELQQLCQEVAQETGRPIHIEPL